MEQITTEILKLREEYIKQGKAVSFAEINHGICFQFAEDLIQRLPDDIRVQTLEVNSDEFKIILSEDGPEGNEEWDLAFLENEWGISPPTDLSKEQFMRTQEFLYHAWVFCDGKHYDSETPEGVQSFFDFPVFRRFSIGTIEE